MSEGRRALDCSSVVTFQPGLVFITIFRAAYSFVGRKCTQDMYSWAEEMVGEEGSDPEFDL